VVAHGLTNSSWSTEQRGIHDWTSVVAAGRCLLRYDARGHGDSTGDPVPEQYQWPQLAEDLLALLDELAPDTPVAGIGVSMGTATLLQAAVQAPGRFDRLVLTSPPTGWETRAAQAEVYHAAADLVEREGVAGYQTVIGRAPIPPIFKDLPSYPPPPELSERLLPSALRGAASSDLPSRDVIAALGMPVLVLCVADDPAHPVSTGEELVALMADADLHVAHTREHLQQWGGLAAAFLNR
jgi:pimeloyl-ACP methyl ester carboxylesterase